MVPMTFFIGYEQKEGSTGDIIIDSALLQDFDRISEQIEQQLEQKKQIDDFIKNSKIQEEGPRDSDKGISLN